MKRFFLLFLLLTNSGSGGSCGWQDPNQIAPSVSSTTPANGAGGVAINQAVTATFNTTMDTATISTTTFSLNNGATGTVSLDSTKLIATFTPSANLTTNTNYTATLTTGAKNTNGVALANNYTWVFQTSATTSPTVSSTDPASGATGVAVNKAISATFSVEMNASTITTTTFSIAGVTGTISMNATKKIATFTPTALLTAKTQYTATVSTGVKDSSGNPLQSATTWSFTTGTSTP